MEGTAKHQKQLNRWMELNGQVEKKREGGREL